MYIFVDTNIGIDRDLEIEIMTWIIIQSEPRRYNGSLSCRHSASFLPELGLHTHIL